MPLLAAEHDLPGVASERPPGQRVSGGRAPLGRPAALRAGRGSLVAGAGGGVLVEILLQEEGGQLAGEGAGALLALAESNRGLGLLGVEVEVEDGRGLLEPLRAEVVTISRAGRCSWVHGVRRW